MNSPPRLVDRTPRFSRFPYIALPLVWSLGCGPDKPPDEPTQGEEQGSRGDYDSTADIEVMADVGALPEEETVNAFKNAFPAIQDCFVRGAERIEFLGGEIAFAVEVDRMGSVSIFAKETTIGDRTTETCMIEALKSASWPRPVGGRVGTAENGFGFEMTGDVRPPVPWDEAEISDVLNENSSALEECKAGSRGSFTATVYVDRDGKALGAGISPPSQEAERRVDCIVDVLQAATYPSPGSWPAKVTFQL
jgi:hypothetical protein